MLGSSGLPVFPIDVVAGRGVDVTRQGASFRFDLDDHAIVTGGSGSLFTVSTELGDTTLRRGLGLVILAGRDFTGAPRLQVDDAVAKPWLDVEGQPLARVTKGRLYRVTYDTTLDAFRSDSPVLVANNDLVEAPKNTIKGNAGDGNADLAVDEARTLLGVDRVTNKSETELATTGPIAEALAASASDEDITAALAPVIESLNTKASEASVSDRFSKRATVEYVNGQVSDLNGEVDRVDQDILSLKQQVAAIAAGTSSGAIIAQTWAALSAIAPVANQRAEVLDSDTGTHTDPVTGAANTPNPGTFVGRTTSPAGWLRIGRTTAAEAAAQVAAGLVAKPLTSAIAVQLVRKDPTTGTLELLSVEDSKAYIRDNSMLQLYPFPADGLTVSETPTLFKAADPQLHAAFFQIPDADVAIDMDGGLASFNGTCPIVYAGEKGTFDFLSGKPFSWVARKPIFRPDVTPTFPVPAVVKYFRKVNQPPPTGVTEGDRRVAAWPDRTINETYRALVVSELNKLVDSQDILSKLTLILIPVNSKANLAINLAKPSVKMKLIEGTAGITLTPYRSVRGGADAAIDTNLFPADLGLTTGGHFFGAQALPGTIEASGRIGGNSPNYNLGPNATNTLAAFRAASGQETATAAPGSWVAMNRTQADSFDIYVEDALVRTATNRPTGDLGERTLYLLANHTSNGLVNSSALDAQVIIHGFGLQTPQSVSRVRAFAKAIIAGANAVPTGA